MRFSLRPLLVAVAAVASAATAAPAAPAPVADLPAVREAAATSLPSSVWRYGRAYPNGLPAARTNTTAYAAPAVVPSGGAAPWIASATPDGWVRVRAADTGAVVRDLHLSDGGIQASPAVVDWDRDGRSEVVVANLNGRLVVWNPGDGRVHLDVTIFTDNFPTHARGIFGTPAVGDLDGDGFAEIVVTSWDHYLYVVDHAGNVRKKVFLRDTSWASPAIADVDGNGSKEIVAAWDCDANSNNFECPYGQPGGFVGVFDQHLNRRWLQFMPGQAAWSSPAVGPLQGNGRQAIVLATGQMPCMMHTGASGPCGTGSAVDTRSTGRRLYAFDAATGSPLPGWPAPLPEKTMSSPALADVDGDGRQEAFVATDGKLYRFDSDGRARWGWDTCIALARPCPAYAKVDASPVVGDLMGDGRQLVAIGYDFRIHLVDAQTGVTVAQAEPARASGEISHALGNGITAAAWGGRTRLYTAVMLCRSDCYGRSPVWDAATVSVDAGRAGSALGWPTFRGSMDRTGRAAVPPPVPSGAIGDYWSARGGANGPYGQPLTHEYGVAGGRAQDFTGGRIYWSSGTGAHGVRGGILQRYLAVGGPSSLGLPTGDEVDTPPTGARVQAFQRGRVYWSSGTGAHPVTGGILEHYLSIGGPAGSLGLPTSAEEGVPGGRMSAFQRGRIYWSSAAGSVDLYGGILSHYLSRGGPARYGMPTRREHDRDGARAAAFQNGRIWWTADRGARSMQGAVLQHFDATGGAARYGLPAGDEQQPEPGVAFSWLPGGEIWWSSASGVHAVRGAILARYAGMGGRGAFGLPTTDEAPSARPGAQWQAFQRGEMHWSSGTGAHPVRGAILERWRAEGKESGRLGLPVSGETDRGSFVEQAYQGGFVHYDKATGGTVVYGR